MPVIATNRLKIEEWTFYVLTLGPLAVLKLNVYPNASTEATFQKAQQMGLTKWDVPETGSTWTSFLREAVSRTYETRAPGRAPPPASQQPARGQMQEVPKLQESEPPSKWSLASVDNVQWPWQGSDSGSSREHLSFAPSYRAGQSFLDMDDTRPEQFDATAPDYPKLQPTPLPAAVVDPVDRAINMMVNKLGFNERDAKWALKITDQGDSLDVDAAIRLLVAERKKRERNHLFSRISRSTSREKCDSQAILVDPMQHTISSGSGPGWRWA
jgi:hypothetical protein